jgi:hypothetical protein
MTPVIYALPFDPTRLLARNRVLREYHDLSLQAGLTYRTLVLNHGYFYTEHVEVMDSAGFVLTADEDFQCVAISAEGGVETGFEMAAVIVITNPRVTQDVYVNASMVGGKYCDVTPAIADMSAGLLNPTRNPTWRNITGKPDEFEVGGHLHAMWELYGFEGFCTAIDRITIAKLAVSARTYQQVQIEYGAKMDILDDALSLLLLQLAEHLAAKNPHKVTKTQAGLSDVQNYSVVTSTEATTKGFTSASRYLTVQRFKQMLDVNAINDINAHINNTNNPHGVTAAQAGTLTTNEAEVQLSSRLDKTAKAISTYKLQGYDWNNLYNYTRTGLNGALITQGIVNMRRIVASQWPGGFCAKLTGSCIATPPDGNSYMYEPISYTNVTIAPGDKLVYDLWVDTGVFAGLDAQWGPNIMADALRFVSLADQNGISQHPAAIQIPSVAGRQWYTRTIDLSAVAGRTLNKWNLAIENDGVGSYSAYVREARVVNAAGQVKAWVFNAGSGMRDTRIVTDLIVGFIGSKFFGDENSAGAQASAEQIVVGNNMLLNIKDIINTYARKGTKMVYLQGANGTNIAATLAATYQDVGNYPVGSLALVMTYYGGSWDYGNATEARDAWRMQCWVKVDAINWQAL